MTQVRDILRAALLLLVASLAVAAIFAVIERHVPGFRPRQQFSLSFLLPGMLWIRVCCGHGWSLPFKAGLFFLSAVIFGLVFLGSYIDLEPHPAIERVTAATYAACCSVGIWCIVHFLARITGSRASIG